VAPLTKALQCQGQQMSYLFYFDETTKSFPKFNAIRRCLLIKINSPGEKQEPTSYLCECITRLTNYLVDKVPERDMVGLTFRKTENVEHKWSGLA
jgi:hypothetical protein